MEFPTVDPTTCRFIYDTLPHSTGPAILAAWIKSFCQYPTLGITTLFSTDTFTTTIRIQAMFLALNNQDILFQNNVVQAINTISSSTQIIANTWQLTNFNIKMDIDAFMLIPPSAGEGITLRPIENLREMTDNINPQAVTIVIPPILPLLYYIEQPPLLSQMSRMARQRYLTFLQEALDHYTTECTNISHNVIFPNAPMYRGIGTHAFVIQ